MQFLKFPKNKFFLSLVVVASLSSCNISSDGASDPTKTIEEFTHPTGVLSSLNSKDVVNEGIYGVSSIIYNNPRNLFVGSAIQGIDIPSCTDTSDITTEIDWNCSFQYAVNCTASGTSLMTDHLDNVDSTFVTADYAGFSQSCSGMVQQKTQGQINIARFNNNVFCSNISNTQNGFAKDFNGCKNSTGQYLVRTDNDSFVVQKMDVNAGCLNITATILTHIGIKTVVCDITNKNVECSNPADINTIDNCVIQ